MSLEIEVKFHIPNPDRLRERISRLAGRSAGRFFESNVRFEDNENSLIQRRALLRLRKDRKARLTFKSEPPAPDHRFKLFNELEVEVSDFDIMGQILESVGFHREQVYEKWRETFMAHDTALCIDTLPYGCFLEIEGAKETIRPLADQLGLQWDERILTNYLAMFETIKSKAGLPFNDVTFDNFKNRAIDITDYLHLFIKG